MSRSSPQADRPCPLTDTIARRMEVAIAGGSLAGLCTGNALLAAGIDVHVFERSASRLTSRGAGIVVQPELLGLLADIAAPRLATTRCTTRRIVDGATGAVSELPMPQSFTSWEAIYTALRAVFPDERYHAGATLRVGATRPDGVDATADDTPVDCQLLVAADGFRSPVRAAFAPETMTRYAGYIAWRGVVDEADAPADLVSFFDDTFTFCRVQTGGHALCYLIPGEGLNTAAGFRRLNWVWYVPVDDGAALYALMTDRRGQRRDATVPQGFASEPALEDLYRRTSELDRHFGDLVRATPEPFIQAIMDVAPPAMVFGRVCLTGDAAFVVRPHTAAAAAKAAADASALAEALRNAAPDIDAGLKAWERTQIRYGRDLLDYGTKLGERSSSRA